MTERDMRVSTLERRSLSAVVTSRTATIGAVAGASPAQTLLVGTSGLKQVVFAFDLYWKKKHVRRVNGTARISR